MTSYITLHTICSQFNRKQLLKQSWNTELSSVNCEIKALCCVENVSVIDFNSPPDTYIIFDIWLEENKTECVLAQSVGSWQVYNTVFVHVLVLTGLVVPDYRPLCFGTF